MTERNTPGFWVTDVSDVTTDDVYIRGYPLQSVMGKLSFPAAAALLIRGKMPTPNEARMLDVILCSILDYSLQKSGTIAARSVVSVNPQMTAGLAAGVLGAGEYAMSPEPTGRFIAEHYQLWKASNEKLEEATGKLVEDLRRQKKRIPGLGHPIFRRFDPRAKLLRDAAVDLKIWGPVGTWYESVHTSFKTAVGKPDLVINDIGMIACILTELGYTPPEMVGIALLSTFPGLIAHVSEELKSGAPLRAIPDGIAHYARNRRDIDLDMKSAGWGS